MLIAVSGRHGPLHAPVVFTKWLLCARGDIFSRRRRRRLEVYDKFDESSTEFRNIKRQVVYMYTEFPERTSDRIRVLLLASHIRKAARDLSLCILSLTLAPDLSIWSRRLEFPCYTRVCARPFSARLESENSQLARGSFCVYRVMCRGDLSPAQTFAERANVFGSAHEVSEKRKIRRIIVNWNARLRWWLLFARRRVTSRRAYRDGFDDWQAAGRAIANLLASFS